MAISQQNIPIKDPWQNFDGSVGNGYVTASGGHDICVHEVAKNTYIYLAMGGRYVNSFLKEVMLVKK